MKWVWQLVANLFEHQEIQREDVSVPPPALVRVEPLRSASSQEALPPVVRPVKLFYPTDPKHQAVRMQQDAVRAKLVRLVEAAPADQRAEFRMLLAQFPHAQLNLSFAEQLLGQANKKMRAHRVEKRVNGQGRKQVRRKRHTRVIEEGDEMFYELFRAVDPLVPQKINVYAVKVVLIFGFLRPRQAGFYIDKHYLNYESMMKTARGKISDLAKGIGVRITERELHEAYKWLSGIGVILHKKERSGGRQSIVCSVNINSRSAAFPGNEVIDTITCALRQFPKPI